jgi:peroxiredoxin
MHKRIMDKCFFAAFLLISSITYAQKQFQITIRFVPKLDTNDIEIQIFDGKNTIGEPSIYRNGKIEINAPVFSKYAALFISSKRPSTPKSFLITKDRSTITYCVTKDTSQNDFPYDVTNAINAIELLKCEEVIRLRNFARNELQDVKAFKEKHQNNLVKSDSLLLLYKQKSKDLFRNNLEFIKRNSDKYFYLWYFNLVLKNHVDIDADSLLLFYKETLYPRHKNKFEAEWVLNYLQARTLEIGNPAPDFTAKDIKEKKVSLKQLKGKFVLLNFWATWCAPCVAELPLFRKLRDDIPADKLEILSVSADTKQSDLENGIKKFGLDWIHIFKDETLVNKYNFAGGIPKTFLIDKDGRLVFKQLGSLNNTDEIRKLISAP